MIPQNKTYEEKRDEAAKLKCPMGYSGDGALYYDDSYVDGFKAGADWARNNLMSDVKKLVETLEFYKRGDHYDMRAGLGAIILDTGKMAKETLTEFKKKYPEV